MTTIPAAVQDAIVRYAAAVVGNVDGKQDNCMAEYLALVAAIKDVDTAAYARCFADLGIDAAGGKERALVQVAVEAEREECADEIRYAADRHESREVRAALDQILTAIRARGKPEDK